MEPLTREKLEEVKKFAETLGFECYVHDGAETASYISHKDVSVFYNLTFSYSDVIKTYGSIVIRCECLLMDVEQTKDFIKFMNYAVGIAEKLKEE